MGNDFSYEVIETFGILSKSKAGWTTEVNEISWNGNEPKIDIRAWSPDHQKMSKGISLSRQEIQKLKVILNKC